MKWATPPLLDLPAGLLLTQPSILPAHKVWGELTEHATGETTPVHKAQTSTKKASVLPSTLHISFTFGKVSPESPIRLELIEKSRLTVLPAGL